MIMAIPVEKEGEELFTEFGIYEQCVFCKQSTHYWHVRTNNAVCKSCAKKHKVSELHNWRKTKKT
jgi:acetyl-CoA carboxylase beta subunit